VRLQLFGDLGPKMLDLLARPDRIAGYFPQTREGVDCALPARGDAASAARSWARRCREFLRAATPRDGIREERAAPGCGCVAWSGAGVDAFSRPDGTGEAAVLVDVRRAGRSSGPTADDCGSRRPDVSIRVDLEREADPCQARHLS
jgi:hypothetical protein